MLAMRACTNKCKSGEYDVPHVRSQSTGNDRYQVCMERYSQSC